MQTATGVKDIYTQYWIDDLLERAKTMKKEEPTRSWDSIQVELMTCQWVTEHITDIYSGFLTLKGTLNAIMTFLLHQLMSIHLTIYVMFRV